MSQSITSTQKHSGKCMHKLYVQFLADDSHSHEEPRIQHIYFVLYLHEAYGVQHGAATFDKLCWSKRMQIFDEEP